MSDKKEIHVNIGEVKIGKEGDVLKATLGSCVGIAFLWKEKKLFGLAHCLLPERQGTALEISGKYVSQAIPSLIVLMKIKEEDIQQIQVVLAGGGNMMSQLTQKNTHNIGRQNIESARAVLKSRGFFVKYEDVGGDGGRQIFIDCNTGDVDVLKLKDMKSITQEQ